MSSLEAKIVVLGAQGVGKTSLVTRYCNGSFDPSKTTSTVGASFMTKRVVDNDTDTVVRLQIWDTGELLHSLPHAAHIQLPHPKPLQEHAKLTALPAGQERFRSISRLYYRGANACILCYSITDANSFNEMGIWLHELRTHLPGDVILHVVGTKADMVARDPAAREVPFERCIAYVAENLAPGLGSTPPPTASMMLPPPLPPLLGDTSRQSSTLATVSSASVFSPGITPASGPGALAAAAAGASGFAFAAPSGAAEPRSPSSKRSSGFWGQEAGWDACHEISAESGDGVEEVFRVVTRKLVEQNKKLKQALLTAMATPGTPGYESGMDGGYFEGQHARNTFRVGRDRRSWLFPAGFSPAISVEQGVDQQDGTDGGARGKKKCCT